MAVVQSRIGAIFGLFFLLLVLAAGRTLYLGTVHSGTLRQAARAQQLTAETVPAVIQSSSAAFLTARVSSAHCRSGLEGATLKYNISK